MADSLSHSGIVVVADDSEGDRFLIQKAMEESGIDTQIQFLEDGQKLVEQLTRAGSHPSGPQAALPCLILLDLNMPRLDGREVLRLVKANPALKHIPIVVLTSSANPDDVASSYEAGANSFFTKPLNYTELVGLMTLLKSYWLEAAKLPGTPARPLSS